MSNPAKTPSAKESTLKGDLLASVVAFLVALPLCMGIAIASGVPVAAGLISGIIGGIVVGYLAGCPLQVTGPAAGLTVVVYEFVREFGLEMLGIVVLLAGVFQLLAGMLKLGQWFRAVSPAVIQGMLAGIGVLIFASQFHVMMDDKPKGSGWQNLVTIPNAISKGLDWQAPGDLQQREFRTAALRRVGELHRRQVQVAEHVAEQLPNHASPQELAAESSEKITVEATGLATVVPEQELITVELQGFLQELKALVAAKSEKELANEQLTAAVEACQLALEQSQAAEADLKTGQVRHAIDSQHLASVSLANLNDALKNHSLAAQLGVLTIVVILLWQGFAPKKLKVLPAPLIGVVVTTVLAAFLVVPVLYVEVPTNLWEEVRFPTWSILQDVPWTGLIMSAAVIAVVASAETLLCATAVDQMQSGPRTKYDQELIAQGVGNMLCGLVGSLPVTGVIVRSSANIQAGGKTRLSAMLHGTWLLVFVVALAALLRLIPTSALAAILVYTGYKLVSPKSIKQLRAFGWGEVGVYFATVITIVGADLLKGVLLGVGLSALLLLFRVSHLRTRLQLGSERAVLYLSGAATFLRLPHLARTLERVPAGRELYVDFQDLDYIDHACINLLISWATQHEATGGKIIIDWERLNSCLRAGQSEVNSVDEVPSNGKFEASSGRKKAVLSR